MRWLVLALLPACDPAAAVVVPDDAADDPVDTDAPGVDTDEAPADTDVAGDDTAADVEALCHVGFVGGGFYAELRAPGDDALAAFLWTEDNCTLTADGLTVDLSDTYQPRLAVAYPDDEAPRAWVALEPRAYEAEPLRVTFVPRDGLPPMGPEMGMRIWVADAASPEVVVLEGLLWAP